jgi:hypothetical protein
MSALCARWERNVTFAMLSYDETSQLDPRVDRWMVLAQNAALISHPLILEDGPVLAKESGPNAEPDSEILEDMYAQGCTSVENARIVGRAGGLDTDPASIVSKDPRVVPT